MKAGAAVDRTIVPRFEGDAGLGATLGTDCDVGGAVWLQVLSALGVFPKKEWVKRIRPLVERDQFVIAEGAVSLAAFRAECGPLQPAELPELALGIGVQEVRATLAAGPFFGRGQTVLRLIVRHHVSIIPNSARAQAGARRDRSPITKTTSVATQSPVITRKSAVVSEALSINPPPNEPMILPSP